MTDATIAKDETAIREVMAAYNAALNGGKTSAVLPLILTTAFSCRHTASRRWK